MKRDGYLPLEDHGLIGDGTTAALVGRDGAVSWLCLPRFDSRPLFCSLLDAAKGGRFVVAPEQIVEARQRYEDDTAVLVTEVRGPDGLVQITDLLPLQASSDLRDDAGAARGELLRLVRVPHGRVRLRIEIDPRDEAEVERAPRGLRLRLPTRPDLDLHLGASVELKGRRTVLDLAAEDRLHLLLCWRGGGARSHNAEPESLLDNTLVAWRRWIDSFSYEGPEEALVRRSALTLKLLDHLANGAIVAAPTSSLPEAVGGVRNWDYRYAWIRDAAFSVYALRRIGFPREASGFLGWVLEAIARSGRPRVLYDLDGREPPPEREDPELEGYRSSAPVRWGNAADDQRQHDVFGEILDCAWQWVAGGREIDEPLWARLHEFIEAASVEWRDPDHGIWEVRTPGRPFTYSAALCQVALDRGARLAERLHLQGDSALWRTAADEIRQAILTEAWSPELGALTEHLGGGGLDASLLALPLRRVVPADDPRMIATTRAVRERLGAGDGLLYRYLPEESPDGLPGGEGAFILCSFWLVDNLASQGRLDEACALFESICRRASPLGLLPEQIDARSGAFRDELWIGWRLTLRYTVSRMAERLPGRQGETGERRRMPRSIVCGVDDSHGARRAAGLAARLCDRLGLRLVLVHVAHGPATAAAPVGDVAPPPFDPRGHDVALAESRRFLEDVVESEGLGDAMPRAAVGDPAECLLLAAEEEDAAIIAVGSRGRGAVKTAVFGSVSSAVAARALCPVVVLPEGADDERDLDTGAAVVCGVDESEHARQALRVALWLSERLGERLVIVHVAPLPFVPGASTVPGAAARVRELEVQHRRRVLARVAAAEQVDRHVARHVARHVVFGGPAERLAEAAGEHEAGLLVVGCRGRGARRAALMGSVSRELVGRARCPVVIVPAGAVRAGVEQSEATGSASTARLP